MSAYIMSGGSLLEVGCPTRLNRSTQQRIAFRTTRSGQRKAFVRRGGRRSWSIETGLASPSEVSTIEAVARAMVSVGWYGPEAAAGNLYSPQASAFEHPPEAASLAGMVEMPDGTVAHTITSPVTVRPGSAHGSYEGVPVRAGQPMTVGCWSKGGQWFRGFWRDAAGLSITNWSDGQRTWSGWAWHEVTLTPPPGAAFLDAHLAGADQYALPSVSWGTTAARELGTGCPKAIIHEPQHSPVVVTRDVNLTDSSFTVTEIG